MKKGFISMTVVYTFLVIFLVLMTSFLSTYVNRNKLSDALVNEVKTALDNDYYLNVIIEER